MLALHLVSLLSRRHLVHLVLELNILLHPILTELVVQHALVGVLQLLGVKFLLFYLLRSLYASSLVTLPLLFFVLVFLFLLAQGEVCHVLLVDVRLFVKSCTLSSQVTLLVGIPRIVVKLRRGRQVRS